MADKPIVLQQVFPLWQAQSPAAELEVTHVDLHPERRTVSVRLQGYVMNLRGHEGYLMCNERDEPIVFLLWGRFAKDKRALITNPHHHVLTAAHPSPLSAYNGFFGCGHFNRCNEILKQNGETPIDWRPVVK